MAVDPKSTSTETKDAQTAVPSESKEQTIANHVEQAKRAFALRKFEEAIDHYASALEIMTELHGEDAPESADLLLSYGKALLENAIAQAGVMGKEETDGALKGEDKDANPSGSSAKGKVIHFSGDAEDDDDEDEPADLLGKDAKEGGADEGEDEDGEEEGGEEEGEPEDDFNAAWEVLELARSLYAKQDGEDVKLKLADTYIALGDVSLETEKFDQAITDYSEGLRLKTELLPVHSRQIAEAHYRLSMVLDLTSGRLSDAIDHAEKALMSVDAKLETLRQALPNAPETAVPADGEKDKEPVSAKGKGKAKAVLMIDSVEGLTKAQIEAQIKEFEELKNDLSLKVEDLKTAPETQAKHENAQDVANKALDELLNANVPQAAAAVVAASSGQVHDLTSMVKKKKKVEVVVDQPMVSAAPTPPSESPSITTGKRKADEKCDAMEVEKKPKLATDVEMEG